MLHAGSWRATGLGHVGGRGAQPFVVDRRGDGCVDPDFGGHAQPPANTITIAAVSSAVMAKIATASMRVTAPAP
jgi:hypothetical protein